MNILSYSYFTMYTVLYFSDVIFSILFKLLALEGYMSSSSYHNDAADELSTIRRMIWWNFEERLIPDFLDIIYFLNFSFIYSSCCLRILGLVTSALNHYAIPLSEIMKWLLVVTKFYLAFFLICRSCLH